MEFLQVDKKKKGHPSITGVCVSLQKRLTVRVTHNNGDFIISTKKKNQLDPLLILV